MIHSINQKLINIEYFALIEPSSYVLARIDHSQRM